MAEIQGLRELSARLSEMGAAAGGKILRSALMTASLPGLRAVQAAAPVGSRAHRTYKGRLVAPGFLKRNIRRKSMLRTGNTRAMVLIGPAQEAFYGKFLEFGTKYMAAQPFMAAAFESAVPAMTARFSEQLKLKIERAAAGNKVA